MNPQLREAHLEDSDSDSDSDPSQQVYPDWFWKEIEQSRKEFREGNYVSQEDFVADLKRKFGWDLEL